MRPKTIFTCVILFFLTACSSEGCTNSSVFNVSCEVAELITAIENANANPDNTTIHLEAGCIYELDALYSGPGTSGMAQVTGLPPVSTTINIKGHNATIQRQLGAPNFRIFYVTGSGGLGLHDLTIRNGAVINSVYNFGGGGIYVHSGTLTLLNSHLENNTAEDNGGGIYNMGGTVNIDTSTITSNHAEDGGGIFNYLGTVIVHNSSAVTNNTAAESGGGITSYNGEVTIGNSQVNNNQAVVDGGALYIIKVTTGTPDLTIGGSLFDGNTTNDKGGAIYMEETTFSIMDSTFTNNQASGTPWSGDNSTSTKGGAIYIEDSMSGTIGFGSLFELNSTDGGGGAIGIDNYVNENWITIEDTSIQNNTAGTRGGGIHNYYSNLSIINSTISSNTALTDEGGGLFHQGELIIVGSTFLDNSSALNGGGVHVYNSQIGEGVTITDSTFQGNQTSEYGGGLSSYNSRITIEGGSLFDGNTAQKGGGGIYNGQSSYTTLVDSTVSNNQALTSSTDGFGGGGIYNASQWTVSITSTTISGNTSNWDGGGLLSIGYMYISESAIYNNAAGNNGGGILTLGRFDMINSTVSGNQAGNTGGGVYAVASLPGYSYLINNTIVHNSSIASPGGLLANNNSSSTILNIMIALNTPSDCSNINAASVSGENLDSDGTCTGFTITADPLIGPLADNSGPTWTHALLPGSPALDAAANCTAPYDQRYAVRPGGSACDIGAYEESSTFVPQPLPIIPITPTPSTYSCEGILGVAVIEDGLIRIQISTPGLLDGIYDAMAGESEFICKTYPEYPDKLFCDGPRGEPGTFATLLIYDPLGLPFCELTFGFPSRDVPDKPEEPKGCSKYTNDFTCNADPKCFWNKTTDTCQTK